MQDIIYLPSFLISSNRKKHVSIITHNPWGEEVATKLWWLSLFSRVFNILCLICARSFDLFSFVLHLYPRTSCGHSNPDGSQTISTAGQHLCAYTEQTGLFIYLFFTSDWVLVSLIEFAARPAKKLCDVQKSVKGENLWAWKFESVWKESPERHHTAPLNA